MSRARTAKTAAQPARSVPAPFTIGDWVEGWTLPEPGTREQPELHEGEVVQVGSGWNGVDADAAYLWVRLPGGTEQRLAIRRTTRTQRPAA
ncbi:hypothetical protein J7I97_36910 [Streptomyces sp. ISL-87]|uniref:hypothetical protein n=1 Tax=Streptomyces sp. ISL-87 TaxID=2819188 RepID=UPI001BE93434|nr:hypothetical protein [Streptomyces sp. ISL-87]MBT2613643.1 hypothetical protein [Streptomyces sp. ISL-87]